MIIVDDKIAIEVPKKVQVKGIYIPEAHKTIGLVEGTVIKVGPGRYYPDGQRRAPGVKEGDRVIINNIAAQTGLPKKDVSVAVEAFMEELRQSLINKENVYLRGFGSFIVKHRAQKTARNISKNTTIVIEAHDMPAFKPAKSFVEKMQ